MKQNKQQKEKSFTIDFEDIFGRPLTDEIKSDKIPEKYVEQRPWGNFEQFSLNTPCTVKIINVNPNSALSLQYHNKRSEFWRIIDGVAIVLIGGHEQLAFKGDEFIIPKKTKHQVETKMYPVQILEISFGPFDEDDIVRLSDIYDRT